VTQSDHVDPGYDAAHGLPLRAALISLSLAAVLTGLKLAGAIVTGSVALLSTLLDSVADVAAVLLTLVAVAIARRPADHEHRFGHGKAEGLSALGQMAFILLSAGAVLASAVDRMASNRPVRETEVGVAVMAVSAVLTVGVVLYQQRVVRRTGSQAIAAARANFTGDLAVSAGIIATLVLVDATGETWLDPSMAFVVAAYLVRNAWVLWNGAADVLLDRELPDEERERIHQVVLRHPETHGIHDVRTRTTGMTRFVELHLELEGGLTLERAHEVVSEVEAEIAAALPGAEVLIHPEPAGIDDERLDHRIEDSVAWRRLRRR